MGSMEEFIHYANLIIAKRLANPSITDKHRRMLARLVAQEEAKRFHEEDGGNAEQSIAFPKLLVIATIFAHQEF